MCDVDHQTDAVIVEFADGTVGRYNAQFLLDHINSDNNWDVTNLKGQNGVKKAQKIVGSSTTKQ